MADAEGDDGPRRRLTLRDQIDCVPVYVVWEITLACNLKCIHCGSGARPGPGRPLKIA
jgi:MoaA/NifB/PqqE/SkfB family radical SAM enzyme